MFQAGTPSDARPSVDFNKTRAVGYDPAPVTPSMAEVGAKIAANIKDYANAAPGSAGDFVWAKPYAEQPRVGDIVLVDIGSEANGTRIHPAIVTRVWGPTCINARAILDGGGFDMLNSLTHKSLVPPPSSYAQPRPRYWYHRYEDGPIA